MKGLHSRKLYPGNENSDSSDIAELHPNKRGRKYLFGIELDSKVQTLFFLVVAVIQWRCL